MNWQVLLTDPLFLVFGWLTLTSLVSTVAYYWHKARRDDIDGALKQDMLQRGMSAEEIVKVLNAGRKPASTTTSLEKQAQPSTSQPGLESR